MELLFNRESISTTLLVYIAAADLLYLSLSWPQKCADDVFTVQILEARYLLIEDTAHFIEIWNW